MPGVAVPVFGGDSLLLGGGCQESTCRKNNCMYSTALAVMLFYTSCVGQTKQRFKTTIKELCEPSHECGIILHV